MRIVIGAATHPGRVRERNEDCLFVDGWLTSGPASQVAHERPLSPRPVVLAVLDGMGGHLGGALAAGTAALSLAGQASADPAVFIRFVNHDVVERGRLVQGHAEMGTTIAGIVLRQDEVVVFNVGDSRVYRLVGGFLGQLSVDDLVPDPQGRRKGLISQSLGGPLERAVDPHALAMALVPGQTYLLCTDGLHDHVDDDRVAALAALPPAEAARALVDAALEAGAPDNVSVIVARLEP